MSDTFAGDELAYIQQHGLGLNMELRLNGRLEVIFVSGVLQLENVLYCNSEVA